MKRHPALVPFSHDHHHGLVQARRLRRASASGGDELRDAVRRFLAFFATETAGHFRDEEERLFPVLLDHADGAPEPLVRALVEHVRTYGLVERLRAELAAGQLDADVAAELGRLLERHIRGEERELFPLIEEVVPEQALATLAAAPSQPGGPVVDLTAPAGEGPLWGLATEDLNATLLGWKPEAAVPEHVNEERDVLLVVLEGGGTARIDGEEHQIGPGQAVVLRKGQTRSIAAGEEGLRYVSVHLRRVGLQIGR